MGFERFTQTSARSYKTRLSIRTNGTIGLSAGAVAKFGLSKYEFVVLYYDKEKRLVGLKPVGSEDEEGAHKLNKGKNAKGAWIAASKFIDYYGLGAKKTTRFDARWDTEEEMVIAEIPKQQKV